MKSLENIIKKAILTVATSAVMLFSANAQSYDVNFKVRELTHGTGANIANAVISKDGGDVVKLSNTNGEGTLQNVNGGNMSIKVSHPDYKQFEQTFNITSDTTLYFSLPKNIRVGPWGTDNFNVDWYKKTFRAVGTLGANKDPPHWKQIAPINNRLASGVYTEADSLLVVDAINTLENGTGYDLITLVPSTASKDTTYTIELNSYTNVSSIGYNNNIIFAGNSKITTTSEKKRIIHEINKQFDMWPYFTPIPCPASVMDPAIQTMTDPQVWDLDNIALTIDQQYAKKRKEQVLFLSQMVEFVALSAPGVVPVVYPASNAVDLDTLLNIIGTKDANAIWYDYKITSDIAGNVIVQSQNDVDRPRINVDLEPEKTYYIFERAGNILGEGPWSSGNKITTKAKTIITLPGQASINSPANNATKVGTPVPYSVTAPNATSYRILAARDLAFAQMLKDTLVNVTSPNIPLPNGILVYTKAIGINANGPGPASDIKSFTTIKATPSLISMLYPLNNAVEVVQPIGFISTSGTNAEEYGYEIQTIEGTPVLDSTLNTNGFTYKLNGNREFKIRCWAKNSDVNGPKSAWTNFKTFNNAPSGFDIIITNTLSNGIIQYINKKAVITSTPATDADKDILSKSYHVTGPSLDTIMHATNIETIYLDSARLKPDSQYTITAEVTDESKITPANEVKTVKTPKATTGIDDVIITKTKIYPNPTHDYVNVELELKRPTTLDIELYDLNGKLLENIHERTDTQYNGQVDMTRYKSGMYIIQIHSQNELVKTAKIIKQ